MSAARDLSVLQGNPLPQQGTKQLGPGELEACRLDPAWEARHGIAHSIYCRECGDGVTAVLHSAHLQKHGLTAEEYGLKYPGVRRQSFRAAALQSGRDVQEFMKEFAEYYETPAELEAYRKDPALEARRGIADYVICRVCGRRYYQDIGGKGDHLWTQHHMSPQTYFEAYPGSRLSTYIRSAKKLRRDVEDIMAETAERFLTPEELAERRQNPEWEKDHGITECVVCRVCGRKLEGELPRHVSDMHPWITDYEQAYPGAPLNSPAEREEGRQRQDKYVTKQRELLAAAWRPDDWWEKPIDWRIIGTELLSRPGYMSNGELAERLDDGRLCRCPYGDTWVESIEVPACKKLINKVRKWVDRPGKTGASIPLAAVS